MGDFDYVLSVVTLRWWVDWVLDEGEFYHQHKKDFPGESVLLLKILFRKKYIFWLQILHFLEWKGKHEIYYV